jgi:ASC-1-like (ASCH) protein
MTEYDTSLALDGYYYYLLRRGEKHIEMRKNQNNIEQGDIIRFMKGYDPENGTIYKKVTRVEHRLVENLENEIIDGLGLNNKEQVRDYSEPWVWLFWLEEVDE